MSEIRTYVKDTLTAESTEEMQEVFDRLEDEADAIADQLRAAGAIRIKTGVYSDPDWYRAAQHALKAKRKTQARIARKIKQIRREMNLQRAPIVAELFVEEAKRVLSSDTWRDIMDVALKGAGRGDS